jgi:hypothetical protein
MARTLGSILSLMILSGAALLLGLTGQALHTGWLDPLDWLLPGVAALLLLTLLAWRGEGRIPPQRLVSLWAIVALPMLVLIGGASVQAPWTGMALLAGGLAIAGLGVGFAARQVGLRRWALLAILLILAFVTPRIVGQPGRSEASGPRPLVGIVSGVPLQGAAMAEGQGAPLLRSVGLRSPLWQVLEARFRLRPLDALDESGLSGLDALLLAHPRALAPAELVAIDAWVRRGGRAVVLADPLLHWPDPRPLSHPLRAPLTSLLDPLLSHWGLRLEPARIEDPVERRALETGALLQLSGASRFTRLGDSAGCVLREQGLLADCRAGTGHALLVADADWINDTLWTLAPDSPEDRSARTSDAPDLLTAWLGDEAYRAPRSGSWLADEGSLLRAVRLALGLLALLAVGQVLVGARPSLSPRSKETKEVHKRNKSETGPDMG